jgi:hypothetical protein
VIVSNRDLSAMRDALDNKILQLTAAKSMPINQADADHIGRQIASLSRRRIVLCGAIVNRRLEASKPVVSLSRWVSGDGALHNIPGLDWANAVPIRRFSRSEVADVSSEAPRQFTGGCDG